MHSIFITKIDNLKNTIKKMDEVTREWEAKAARGECSWVCSDCCVTFTAGMPDECPHGDKRCTDIIKRDKEEARNQP